MPTSTEVTIDLIVHATENVSKIFKVFEDVFGIKEKNFTQGNLEGHFDNPIILLNLKLTKKDAGKFIEKLVSKISLTTLEYLTDDIENRVEDSTLHFRLDKEEFVQGKFILGEKNAVKIKIYTPIYSKKEIPQIFADLLHPN